MDFVNKRNRSVGIMKNKGNQKKRVISEGQFSSSEEGAAEEVKRKGSRGQGEGVRGGGGIRGNTRRWVWLISLLFFTANKGGSRTANRKKIK